jgi:hypothetical protein
MTDVDAVLRQTAVAILTKAVEAAEADDSGTACTLLAALQITAEGRSLLERITEGPA